MNEYKLRNGTCGILVLGHVATCLALIVMFAQSGFTESEFTTSLALITPVTGTHVAAGIQFIVRNRHRISIPKKRISKAFAALTLCLVFAVTACLILLVLAKGANIVPMKFETFKNILLAFETTFGVYLTTVITGLYDLPEPQIVAHGSENNVL
ncbi:MAG: hypothetical protein WCK51_05845 [Armatimonadota bacterium]